MSGFQMGTAPDQLALAERHVEYMQGRVTEATAELEEAVRRLREAEVTKSYWAKVCDLLVASSE